MNPTPIPINYKDILHFIITEIKTTRLIVANRVNTSAIQMYWNIGKRLSEESLEKGYGSGVVERLSVDLKAEFPDANGFSPRNLWDMKRFYEFYRNLPQKQRQTAAVLPDDEILPQAVAELLNDIKLPLRMTDEKPFEEDQMNPDSVVKDSLQVQKKIKRKKK
jgi:hypothetical protein